MTTDNKTLAITDVKSTSIVSLLAGGFAGTSVDVILYPLDTLKTRVQSKQGFRKSGGFSKVYRGILPVIIGSAPSASLFFVTYENVKNMVQYQVPERYYSFVHMGSASLAEVVACLIRVPVEVIKQRRQALIRFDQKDFNIRMLYCGYWSTVLRDMPFSIIQFPIWEYFKKVWSFHTNKDVLPFESALCGAVAGGISAAVTTPLDVVKTRIMLSPRGESLSKLRILYVLNDIHKNQGLHGLFSGVGPRVMWITLGGFIFFGSYEMIKASITNYWSSLCLLQKANIKCEAYK